MLSIEHFERARQLALQLAGIELLDRHREVLARRGRRFGLLNGAAFESLLEGVERGDTQAAQKLVCLLTTKFTGFFRHPPHFEIAASHAAQACRSRRPARLWSAATATGEEAYSLAIAMAEAFDTERPPAEILATDVDEQALATARQGEYPELSLSPVSPGRRARFFRETRPDQRWVVGTRIRSLIEFRPLNLVDAAWSLDLERPFDVIFCRNVLMYLQPKLRHAVVERIHEVLEPEGLLIIDPTEHLGAASSLFTRVAEGVYSRRRAGFPAFERPSHPTLITE